MSKFNAGDNVFLSHQSYGDGKHGDKAIVIKNMNDEDVYFVEITSGNQKGKVCIKFERELCLSCGVYEKSNRYKLLQAIEKTGFSSRSLSHVVRGNESFFYNYTGESRFNKRGDISEKVLNARLTDLAFAERELLGLGAKTVDDTIPKHDENCEVFNPHEAIKKQYADDAYERIIGKISEIYNNKDLDNVVSISNDLIETKIKETLSTLDIALKANKSDTNKSNLNKFLIVFVLVLLGLALGFFVR